MAPCVENLEEHLNYKSLYFFVIILVISRLKFAAQGFDILFGRRNTETRAHRSFRAEAVIADLVYNIFIYSCSIVDDADTNPLSTCRYSKEVRHLFGLCFDPDESSPWLLILSFHFN